MSDSQPPTPAQTHLQGLVHGVPRGVLVHLRLLAVRVIHAVEGVPVAVVHLQQADYCNHSDSLSSPRRHRSSEWVSHYFSQVPPRPPSFMRPLIAASAAERQARSFGPRLPSRGLSRLDRGSQSATPDSRSLKPEAPRGLGEARGKMAALHPCHAGRLDCAVQSSCSPPPNPSLRLCARLRAGCMHPIHHLPQR